MVPKLVAEDIPLLFSLLSDVFPGVQYHRGEMTALREELKKVCQEMYLTYGDGEEVGGMWVEKVRVLPLPPGQGRAALWLCMACLKIAKLLPASAVSMLRQLGWHLLPSQPSSVVPSFPNRLDGLMSSLCSV